jgi:hypothetical protein
MKTQRQRITRKLSELRVEAHRRMHAPVTSQHRWLSSVLRGHYAYYGVQSNLRALSGFCFQVRRIWYRSLARRSQRSLYWERFNALLERFPLLQLSASRKALAA